MMMLKWKFLRSAFFSLFLMSIAACQGQKELVSGLTEADANEILVVLQSQKIDPIKTVIPGRVVTYSVSVKEKSAAEALRILVDNKLPRPQSQGLADVYPVGGGGLIPTASEEKAKFLMATQGEIEKMLKILPGIVQVRVVVVLPDTDAIRDINTPPPPATASVAIVYNPIDDKGTPSISPDDVKYLISSAVEDLSPSSVTVVMASNLPMKLVDVAKNRPTKAVAKPAFATGSTDASIPSDSLSSKQGSAWANSRSASDNRILSAAVKAKEKEQEEKGRFLIWLFGSLAVLGLLLGLFGLIRAVSLRSKFAKLQKNLEPNQVETTPEIAATAPKPPEAGAPGA